jgi:hypothetical protein
MVDTYQAVYDAVRSRIGSFDGSLLVDEIARQFDFSYARAQMVQSFEVALYEWQRPCVLFKPQLRVKTKDGMNVWSAYYNNVFLGVGDTPEKAMESFDVNWRAGTILEE